MALEKKKKKEETYESGDREGGPPAEGETLD